MGFLSGHADDRAQYERSWSSHITNLCSLCSDGEDYERFAQARVQFLDMVRRNADEWWPDQAPTIDYESGRELR